MVWCILSSWHRSWHILSAQAMAASINISTFKDIYVEKEIMVPVS